MTSHQDYFDMYQQLGRERGREACIMIMEVNIECVPRELQENWSEIRLVKL